MAAVMDLAIVMVFVSWKFPYRLNRALYIASRVLLSLVMAAILLGSGRVPPLSEYTLYGLLELGTTISIVWMAGLGANHRSKQ